MRQIRAAIGVANDPDLLTAAETIQ